MPSRDVELGFLAHPEGDPVPGVVLLHDVWGLSDHIRDMAGRLAAEGFAVLALDLYRRKGRWQIQDPGAWMRELSDPGALADVQAGVAFLASDPASAGRRCGVAGFCMGGMYALLAACGCEGLSAAVPFYGILSHEHGLLHAEGGLDPARKPRQPLDAAPDLRCPMLAFFGTEDPYIPQGDVDRLKERLPAAGPPAEVVVMAGAGHAFMNDTRPDAYRPEAAREAWARTTAFLREHLT